MKPRPLTKFVIKNFNQYVEKPTEYANKKEKTL